MRLALIGRSGTGKSEVARCFVEFTHGELVKTGTICRQISQLLFGNEEKSSTQILDDALTQIDPSIFLKAALRSATLSNAVVIDSLRFSTDLALAKSLAFRTARVIAIDQTRVNRLLSRGQHFDLLRDGQHRSELELDAVETDYVIDNDGTLDDLRKKVASLLATI